MITANKLYLSSVIYSSTLQLQVEQFSYRIHSSKPSYRMSLKMNSNLNLINQRFEIDLNQLN